VAAASVWTVGGSGIDGGFGGSGGIGKKSGSSEIGISSIGDGGHIGIDAD
jgi:hypothetical protein